jgi:hypothetical protein
MSHREITLDQFHAEMKAQGVSGHEHVAFRCVVCGTIQSGHDLIRAGAGPTFDDVERYLAFSCVGRWTDAGDAPGRGCDWTLGGLFGFSDLVVVTPDGKKHPRFELATPAEAQAHERAQRDSINGEG